MAGLRLADEPRSPSFHLPFTRMMLAGLTSPWIAPWACGGPAGRHAPDHFRNCSSDSRAPALVRLANVVSPSP